MPLSAHHAWLLLARVNQHQLPIRRLVVVDQRHKHTTTTATASAAIGCRWRCFCCCWPQVVDREDVHIIIW